MTVVTIVTCKRCGVELIGSEEREGVCTPCLLVLRGASNPVAVEVAEHFEPRRRRSMEDFSFWCMPPGFGG